MYIFRWSVRYDWQCPFTAILTVSLMFSPERTRCKSAAASRSLHDCRQSSSCSKPLHFSAKAVFFLLRWSTRLRSPTISYTHFTPLRRQVEHDGFCPSHCQHFGIISGPASNLDGVRQLRNDRRTLHLRIWQNEQATETCCLFCLTGRGFSSRSEPSPQAVAGA